MKTVVYSDDGMRAIGHIEKRRGWDNWAASLPGFPLGFYGSSNSAISAVQCHAPSQHAESNRE